MSEKFAGLDAYLDSYFARRGVFFEPDPISDPVPTVGHGPLDEDGSCSLEIVDQYLANAMREGSPEIRAALRDPDFPRRFILPQLAVNFDQIKAIENNSFRVRHLVALGGRDRQVLIDYVRFGEKRRPMDILGRAVPTTGIWTVYQPQGWVIGSNFDPATGVARGWTVTDKAIEYKASDVLRLVAEHLEREAKRRGADEPEVHFSPYDAGGQ